MAQKPQNYNPVVNPAVRDRTRWTNLTALSAGEKQVMWARIQAERPALADLLKEIGSSAVAQQLIDTFGAQLMIEAFDD